MKKFKKSTAIVLSAILSVILIVGVLFSFVPMKFGTKNGNHFQVHSVCHLTSLVVCMVNLT